MFVPKDVESSINMTPFVKRYQLLKIDTRC